MSDRLGKEFEAQFSTEQSEKDRDTIRQNILILSEVWPDFLASWDGMVAETIKHGWTEEVARSMVLTMICSDPSYLAVTHRNCE